MFWEPLAGAVGDRVETVYLTADGAFHFIPMAVLVDGEGEFLCERLGQLVFVDGATAFLDGERGEPMSEVPSWTASAVELVVTGQEGLSCNPESCEGSP